MKFFVDTADVAEIRDLADAGLLDGVTTNPSLIAKSGRAFKEVIAEICKIVEGPVSAEVTALDFAGMIREGNDLQEDRQERHGQGAAHHRRPQGLQGAAGDGAMVNVTLCFSANQALLAAKAGASFISPFVGRLDDIHLDGMELISEIRQIYDNYGFDTEILVASVRSANHVKQAALIGADVVTAPPAVLKGLAKHPLTDKGIEMFLADWKKTGQTIL